MSGVARGGDNKRDSSWHRLIMFSDISGFFFANIIHQILIEIKPSSSFSSELKTVGSTGSTLPEHPRFSPGTHKANNYLKDVWIAYQAIYLPNISKTLKLNFLV